MTRQEHNKIAPTGQQVRLRLLETTDLHMHVLPYDYFADRPVKHFGLSLCARLIDQLRGDADLSLLFDNGDFLQGNPLADWIESELDVSKATPHPIIQAMNGMGYDATTLGNHDFNYGLSFLQDTLAGADFPTVSANLCTTKGPNPGDDITFVPPWTILDRVIVGVDGTSHPLRIGVIGFAPPQTVNWERSVLGQDLASRDIVEAARVHTPILRANGADIVIALAHTGIGDSTESSRATKATSTGIGAENAAAAVATVPGIDVVLAGHTHDIFPDPRKQVKGLVDPILGTLHGKPAVMSGFHGSHIGLIDLVLEHGAQGWEIIGQQSRTIPVTSVADDPPSKAELAVHRSIRSAHEGVLSDSRKTVGHTLTALHSHFALVGPSTAMAATASALFNYARKVLADRPEAGMPLVAAVAPSRFGGLGGPDNYVDIPPGPLLLRHAAELYFYGNAVSFLEVTGADLLAWLETAARQFQDIVPGKADQPLLDINFPGYLFDSLYGLQYVIDPSRSGDQGRISDLRFQNGQAVTPTDKVILVTNSFRASGGGKYIAAERARLVLQDTTSLQEVILRHFRSGPVHADLIHPWRFASLPGTSAWFESGPGALAHLETVNTGTTLQDAGPMPNGFHRFQLNF